MENLQFDRDHLPNPDCQIGGVDEVGRGCLFGDVVAACVIMPLDSPIKGVRDSKKISMKKRECLYEEIKKTTHAIGIGRVNSGEVDRINIKQAARLAMKLAVLDCLEKVDQQSDILLFIDAENVDLAIPQKSFIHGDDLSYSIACASIIAKVHRDRLCAEWARLYPGYDIEKNKGYGTKAHREAILQQGPTPMHRKTFLKKILQDSL